VANVVLPAASFLMGCEAAADDEKPVRRIRLDAFELALCPVTNAEYARFLESTGHSPPPTWNDPILSGGEQPVVSVSWFDAVAYCDWIASETGRAFRLPTEAEWEYAARGGLEGALYPWGDDPPQTRAGYATRWLDRPEPVHSGTPNGYGLLGMCANIHEWCSDWYGPYAASAAENPHGPATGTRRASRGGSWRHQIRMSRCAARSSIPPGFHYADYGFRIALSDPRLPAANR